MARAPLPISASERVNTEAGRVPELKNSSPIGRASDTPGATRITTPSPMKAVLRASATSSLGTIVPS